MEFNPNEVVPLPPVAVAEDWFVSVHQPNILDSMLVHSSVISDEDKRKIKTVKEDDNQIIVFYKLMDF
jgi:hypothetical protein